jgi:hypothetical protein
VDAICDPTKVFTPDEMTEQLLRELKGSPTDFAKLVIRMAPEELAIFSAGGAARDRGAVAPSGLQALLGMEESTPTGSARD